MTVEFLRLRELPAGFDTTDLACWDRSVQVWEARYGLVNGSRDHIVLGQFGVIPVDFVGNLAYVWLRPQEVPPLSAMRHIARAFRSFEGFGHWRLIAFTEHTAPRNEHFALFMGFVPFTEDAKHKYFWRSS